MKLGEMTHKIFIQQVLKPRKVGLKERKIQKLAKNIPPHIPPRITIPKVMLLGSSGFFYRFNWFGIYDQSSPDSDIFHPCLCWCKKSLSRARPCSGQAIIHPILTNFSLPVVSGWHLHFFPLLAEPQMPLIRIRMNDPGYYPIWFWCQGSLYTHTVVQWLKCKHSII